MRAKAPEPPPAARSEPARDGTPDRRSRRGATPDREERAQPRTSRGMEQIPAPAGHGRASLVACPHPYYWLG